MVGTRSCHAGHFRSAFSLRWAYRDELPKRDRTAAPRHALHERVWSPYLFPAGYGETSPMFREGVSMAGRVGATRTAEAAIQAFPGHLAGHTLTRLRSRTPSTLSGRGTGTLLRQGGRDLARA
jgi:hypothetical protein